MKYLAILKDSFRESLDTKVFYVMTVISLLVVLFIGSISYAPAAAEKAIPNIVHSREFRQAFHDHGKSSIPIPHNFMQFEVKNVVALTDHQNASARDHAF